MCVTFVPLYYPPLLTSLILRPCWYTFSPQNSPIFHIYVTCNPLPNLPSCLLPFPLLSPFFKKIFSLLVLFLASGPMCIYSHEIHIYIHTSIHTYIQSMERDYAYETQHFFSWVCLILLNMMFSGSNHISTNAVISFLFQVRSLTCICTHYTAHSSVDEI